MPDPRWRTVPSTSTQDADLDPTSLPLFAASSSPAASPRPGRVRSRFSLAPLVAATDRDSESVEEAPGTAEPVVVGRDRAEGAVDWAMVSVLRSRVADRLGDARISVRDAPTADRERGRAIVMRVIEEHADEERRRARSREAWEVAGSAALAQAVFDSVFGLGRFQPLVDDERVENIMVSEGRVTLDLADGTREAAPPVADSDEELIEWLQFQASGSKGVARPFSPASPHLHLDLPGDARLAAVAWATPRPSVNIRISRLKDVTLDLLTSLNTMTPLAATFLRACVLDRRSIAVAGEMGAGKTTVLRALCNEIPPQEVVGTFEMVRELQLHRDPQRHPIVHAWEERPGSGEYGPDGREAGALTILEALKNSYRFNLERYVLGEVRGAEVVAMVEAMQSGGGSLSTVHSRDAASALRKLVTCMMSAGEKISPVYAAEAIADAIDVVVYVTMDTGPDGRRRRWVSEILAVTPGERNNGWATSHVFLPGPGGRLVPGVLPEFSRSLEQFGFDPKAFGRGLAS